MSSNSPAMPKTAWYKSSYSSGINQDNCVETAALHACVGVRDSKDPEQGHLELPKPAWSALLDQLSR